jgi:hypothetical protein
MSYNCEMPRYRFDFLRSEGGVLATHEIDYDSDEAAIAAGHTINGSPPIGGGFQVWRDGELIHQHRNTPQSAPGADEEPEGDSDSVRKH